MASGIFLGWPFGAVTRLVLLGGATLGLGACVGVDCSELGIDPGTENDPSTELVEMIELSALTNDGMAASAVAFSGVGTPARASTWMLCVVTPRRS